MSKQIDERVVSMQFDNKHFESNVQTTMSTIDKLKQKLNFTGASKGLESIGTAANKVNMNGLGTAVETVRTRFSALEVMGVTALANITNAAVNTGKRMISALTIDPIKTGFKEYETQINAVQTILANTQSKGTTLNDVNGALEELNKYADQTIYNFTEMTRNIGTFTAAGVDLDTSVNAIKGIANLAAVSGSTSQQASTAMYQLSQALASGTVKLMDWNSVVNAGMGGQVFQDALKETARVHGIAIDDMIEKNGSFRETLREEWLTSEILTETLQKFTLTTEGLTEEQIKANREMLKAKGYTEAQIDEIFKLGKTATDAATKVKTFTQLWDVIKESAQSGWAQTWKLIIGDFEGAKNLLTPLSEGLTKFIGKLSDARNNTINKVLNTSGWDNMAAKIKAAGLSTETFSDLVKATAKDNGIAIDKLIKKYGSLANVIKAGKIPSNILTKALRKLIGAEKDASGATDKVKKSVEDLDKIVSKVIRGDFGNGEDRVKALTKAGYDYATVQNKVNETLGISYRHISKLTEEQTKNADQLVKLSDAQLKSKGYTDEQVKALRELEKAADDSGESISELISDMAKPSGRDLILDTFSHLGTEIGKIFKAAKEAWDNTFSDDKKSEMLYEIIEKLHDLAMEFEVTEESAEKFKKVFEGIFALFQLTNSIVSASLVGSLKILSAVLSFFDMDLLDLATVVSDYIIKLRDWVKENTFLIGTWDKIGKVIGIVIEGVKNCVKAFMALKPVQNLITKIKDKFKEWFGDLKTGTKISGAIEAFCKILERTFERLETWVKTLDGKSMSEVFAKMSEPFGRFADDLVKACPSLEKFVELLKTAVTAVKDWFKSLKQPDGVTGMFDSLLDNDRFKEAYDIGKNIIEGLKNGFKDGSMSIATAIGTVITGLINIVKSLLGIHSPSTVFFAIGGFIIAGLIGGLLGHTTDIKDALSTIGDVIINFFSELDIGTVIAAGIGIGALVMVKKVLDIVKDFASMAKGIGKMTSGIGDLANTINDQLLGKFKPTKFQNVANGILKLAIAVGILTASIVVLSFIESDKLWKAVGALAVIVLLVGALAGIMTGLMASTKLIAEGENVGKIGTMLLKIAGAVAIMAFVAKMISNMTWEDLGKAAVAIVAFGGFIVGMMAATRLVSKTGNIDSIGGTLFKIAGAIAIMAIVAKVAASMSMGDIGKAITLIGAFAGMIVGLMAATKLIATDWASIVAIGGTLFKIAGAIGIMVLVAKLAATMSAEDVAKATITIGIFAGMIVGLMAATKLIGDGKVGEVGGTLFKAAAAIGIMVLVAKIAATMSAEDIIKGIAVVSAFSLLIVGLMAATRLISKDGKNIGETGGTLLKAAGAIAIMVIVAKLAATMSLGDIVKGIAVVSAFSLIIMALMVVVSKLESNNKDLGKQILMVAGAIAAIGLVVALLSLINPERLATATAAMSVIMGMFALVLLASKNVNASIGPLIVMTVAIGILATALYLIGRLPTDQALAAATSLSVLLLALSAALLVLGNIKLNMKDVLLGVVGLLALCVPLLALVGLLALMQNISNVVPNALALAGLMTVMSLVLIATTAVGAIYTATGGMAATGLLGLLALCVPMLAIIGMLAIMQNIQNAVQNAQILAGLMIVMTTVLTVLAVIGPLAMAGVVAMGYFTALIVAIGALAVGIGALMEKFPAIQKFLDTGVEVLIQLAEGVGRIIGAFVGGMAEEFMSKMPTIGTYLSQFFVNAMPFITGMSSVSSSMLDGVKALAESILILCGANLVERLTSFFGGDSSLASFGSQLGQLGADISTFANNLQGFDETKLETIKCAADAIKALAQASGEISGRADWAKTLFGDNSLATFGDALPALGTNLSTFADNLGTFDDTKQAAIKCAVGAIADLAKASKDIPNEGGWAAKLFGDNSLATYSANLPAVGTNLATFADNLGTFDESKQSSIKCAANAIAEMAKASKDINGQADWAKKLFGDNSLATFGADLGTLGTNLSTFAKNVGTFNEGTIASVNSAVKVIKSIASLANSNLKAANKNLPDFGKKIVAFSEAVAEFCTNMPDAKSLNSAGVDIISETIKGVNTKKDDVKEKFKSIAKDAASAVKKLKSSFKEAGKDLGAGLVNGINAKQTAVYNAGYALGQKAVQGERAGQKSASPSKESYKSGIWFGEGLVNGIDKMGKAVYAAAHGLGRTATKSLSSSISKIANVVDMDIDSQPTIRPVVDLSDVAAGSRAINSMFGLNPSVGLLANVQGISSMMNRNQNGSNDDVVSAIEKLGKAIDGSSGDTYYFGDVRYDDDSTISNAVKTLVRAARVEGRA